MRVAWLLVLGLVATEAQARKHLSRDEARACRASGGYESAGPFGEVFCQIDYNDGGKSCRGKADCRGRCLVEAPDNFTAIKPGTSTAGQCEFRQSTFGCYGRVEGGKVTSEGWICVD